MEHLNGGFTNLPPKKKAAKIIQNRAIFQEKLGSYYVLLCLTGGLTSRDDRFEQPNKGHETSKHIKKGKVARQAESCGSLALYRDKPDVGL